MEVSNKLITSLIILSGLCLHSSRLFAAENFNFRVTFGAKKCINQPMSPPVCSGTGVNQALATVSLDHCPFGTDCDGEWTQTFSIDGYTFLGSVKIMKTVFNGSANYSALISTSMQGNEINGSLALSGVNIRFAKNSMTDSVSALSSWYYSPAVQGVSYTTDIVLDPE